MAKKIYDEDLQLTDINVDWGGDGSTENLPLSGRVVQKFIKDNITDLRDRTSNLEDAADSAADRLDDAETRLDAIDKPNGTVAGLTDRMTGVEDRTSNLEDAADSAADRLDDAETRLDAIDKPNGTVAGLTDRVSNVEDSVGGLSERLDDAEETLSNIDPEAIEEALAQFDVDELNRKFQNVNDKLNGKAGYFYKDSARNQVLVFASKETCDEWVADNTKDELILGTFDAPALYEARINLIGVNTDTYVNYIQYGSKGNRVQATYEITRINGGAPQPEGVVATIILRDANRTTLLEASQNVSVGGTIDLNIDDYIVNGTNTVTIRINSVETHTTASISYTIISSELILSDTFNISNLVEPNGVLNIPWSVRGNGVKYIKWYVDGSDKINGTPIPVDSTSDNPGSGTKQISVSSLAPGKHTIQFYAYTELGAGNYFYSDVLYRDFVVDTAVFENSQLPINYLAILTKFTAPADTNNSIIVSGSGSQADPIILKGVAQYEPKTISYCVYYKDQSAHKNFTILFNTIDDDSRPVTETSDHSVSSLTRVDDYSIRSYHSGASSMIFSCGDENVYFDINVAQSTYDISNNTSNLEFALNGSDRDNASVNRDSWSYTNKNNVTYKGQLTGFNWIENSGWGEGRLIFSPGSKLETDYTPFHRTNNNPIRENGLTFEIEFETRRVLDENAVLLDLRNRDGRGLLITASEISFSTDSSDQSVYTRYKPEENVRLSIVINPYTGNSMYHGILMMYIDGVLTRLLAYGPNDTFESEQPLVIEGIDEATTVIKQIRCYERALSIKEVLDNYILYRDTADELLQAYDRNNIYVDNVISSDKLAEKTPIIIITGPLNTLHNFPKENKSTYVRMEKIEVINPNPDYNMVLEDVSMRCQGTSSMEYPIKNFRFYTQKDSADKTYNKKETAGNEYTTKMWVGGNNPKTDGKELTGKKRKYSFKPGAQPVKCWCLKADYAESSSTHNTGIARLWNQVMRDVDIPAANVSPKYYIQPKSSSGRFNICQTIAQRKAIAAEYPYDVRTTVDGFPISLFYHENENAPLQFVGRYNWNNDKSTESVYGFCDIPGFDTFYDEQGNERDADPSKGEVDYGKTMECWEIIEGDFPSNLFTLDNSDPMNWNNSEIGWMKGFEARYPDDAGDPSEAYRARNTIVEQDVPVWETDPDTGEQILDEHGDPIPVWRIDPDTGNPMLDDEGNPIQKTTKEWVSCEPGALYRVFNWIHSTMGASVVGVNGKMIPVSPNDPRMIKFKTEKWNYLDVYKLAAYYCYLMRFGAVDQVVKNAMFTTEDGLHWYYINYDNDTINGVKNDGSLVFGYKIDRQSREYEGTDAPYCYAGHESVLWNNLEADEEFMDIVRVIDNALYEKGLTYTNVINMFNEEQSAKWSERTHNEDYVYKYLGPYLKDGNNQFAKLQGPRKSHRQWWLSNRFAWMDALNGVGSYRESLISIKPNTQRVRAGDGVTIASSSAEQVFGYSWGNSMRDNNRSAEIGTDIRFNFSTQDSYYIGAELKFYNPVFMTKFDMSDMAYAAQEIMFNKINTNTFDSTLTTIILGNANSEYNRVPNIKIDGLAEAKYLEKFQMNRFATVTNIDLSANKYLKSVDLRYCDNLKDIVLPTGAPITELYYPGNVESLVLSDLVYLTDFALDSYSTVRTIDITGCPNLTKNQSFIFNWLNQKTTADRYCSIHMDNVNWTNVTNAQLNRLITFINNGGTVSLSGHIRMAETINDATFAHNIESAFGGPNIFKSTSVFYIETDPTVLIEGPSVILEGDSGQYTIYYIGNDESRPHGDPVWEITSQIIDTRTGTTIDSANGIVYTTENAQGSKNLDIRVYLGSGSGTIHGDRTINIKKRIYPQSDLSDVYIDGKNNVIQGNNRYTIGYTNNNIDGAMYAVWTVEGALANWCTAQALGDDGMDGCVINMPTTPHGTPAEDYLVVNGTITLTLYYKNYPTPDAEEHSPVGLTGIKSLTIGYKDPSIAVSSATNPYAMAALVNVPNGKVPNSQLLTVAQAGMINQNELQPGSGFATSIFRTGNFYQNCTSFDEFEYFTGLTEIPVYLFYGCSKIESIVLPRSITKICSNAFAGCSSLKSIIIPKNVTEIETSAFANCTSLETVIFEDDSRLTTMGQSVFQNCTKLKNIVLPDGLQTMNSYVFQGCTSLRSITVNVSSIPYDAFYNCTFLSNINFGSNVTRIESEAFRGTAIVNLVIPDTVTYIGSNAFTGCNKLKTAVIANSVTYLGSSAFTSCTSLESLVIGNGVTTIQSSLCSGCTSLKSVHIGAGVTSFPYPGICTMQSGYWKYYSSGSYSYVDQPNIVRGWSNESFSGCINLETITIDESNTTFYDGRAAGGGNCVIQRTGNGNSLIMGCKTSVIPSSCQIISMTAFERLPGLTSINIPADVRTIEQFAFLYCPDLVDVTFADGSSLQLIGQYSFYRCSKINEIHIPDRVTQIAQRAFAYDTGLVQVTFGSRLATISEYAFMGCTGLSSITLPKSITSLATGVFQSCQYLQDLTFEDDITLTSIPGDFCLNCSSLQAISIPNSIQSIGNRAFYGCTAIESIYIGSGLRTISSNAFRFDGNYKSNISEIIVHPENELFIDGRSFSGSNCLISTSTRTLILACKNTVIPNVSPLSIGSYAYAGISGISELIIPGNVQSIESYAFYNCEGIGRVITSDNLVSIGSYAFQKCSSIYLVDLGLSLGNIGAYAFTECTSLKIVISRNPYAPELGGNVFSSGVLLQRIYVPDETAYRSYDGSTSWAPYKNELEYPIPSEYNN